MVRGDHGTENAVVAKLQIAFRMQGDGGEKGFVYGPSTSNTVRKSLV